jgi:hypothetical protein
VFMNAHVDGESFCVLTKADTMAMKMALSDLNSSRYYRLVPPQTLLDSAPVRMFSATGRPWKPWAPVGVTATMSGSDISLAWIRRTRLGGDMQDGTGSVPLSEQFESYEVDVYNAAGDTVLRTLKADFGAVPTTSPGATYTAAAIAEDFGAAPSSLTVVVYQISGVVGRGFGKKVTVEIS